MREHAIKEQDVRQCLMEPDVHYQGWKGSNIYRARVEGRKLKVMVARDRDTVLLATVAGKLALPRCYQWETLAGLCLGLPAQRVTIDGVDGSAADIAKIPAYR